MTEAKTAVENKNFHSISATDFQYSFGSYANLWLEFVKKNRKPSTHAKYRAIYEKYLTVIVDEPIHHIDEKFLCEKVFSKNNVKSDSIKKSIIMIVNQVIKYCNGLNHCNIDLIPSRTVSKKRNVEIFNRLEQQRLLEYLNKHQDSYTIGIIVCLYTGLRLGEICSLKWNDIDFENEIISITSTVQRLPIDDYKTKTILFAGAPKSECSIRDIPIPNELTQLLKNISVRGKYLIAGKKPVEPRTYEKKLASYIKKAGNIEKKNFHALRHTFATNCIESGMDVKCLSEILGHSDVRTTLNKYVHPTTEAKRSHMQHLVSFYGPVMGQLTDEAI